MGDPDGADERPDALLLDDLRTGGDLRPRAWSALVRRHSPRMYAVARSFAVDERTAEDLVQTAWLRLLERAHQVRDGDALGAWLTTVVRNEARRLVTRRREVPTPWELERPGAVVEAADTALLRDEQGALVRLAFARLGADCRQLLRLVLADPPLGYDEIALVLGRPRGSLGPTRRRCLDQLRRHLPAGYQP